MLACLAYAWPFHNTANAQFAAQSGEVRRPVPAYLPQPSQSRGGAEEQSAPDPKQRSTKEKAIEYRLRQPISVCFKDVPLKQALKDLSVHSGIQAIPDLVAFEKARIDLDAPISISVENTEMKSVLNLILKKMELRFIIQNDVLLITTADRNGRMTRVTYPVADLVAPTPVFEGQAAGTTREELLMDLIKDNVAKDSWERMGGAGSMQYFPLGKALVVTQHQEAHEEIQLLLASIRKLNELSVEVETRVVQMSPDMAKHWRKVLAQAGARDVLTFDELHLFMLLESAQGDRTARVAQMPKMTLLNGQRAEHRADEKNATSWTCLVKPVVTPDRRSVRLDLKIEHSASDAAKSIERITKAAKTMEVPDGRSFIWDLGETVERQHLFVVITPRIRVQKEPEERIFLGEIPPIPGR
jgi:hypothetical protein